MKFANCLNNLKVRTKLLLALLIPFMFMIFFASAGINSQWREFNAAREVNIVTQLSLLLADMTHELQKERGLSAGYLGSDRQSFASMVNAQRQLTDTSIQRFRDNLKKHAEKNNYWDLETEFDRLEEKLWALGAMRVSIDINGQEIDYFAYYSELNVLSLNLVLPLMMQGNDSVYNKQGAALSTLLWLQERLAKERGILNSLISKEKPDLEELQKFGVNVTKQQILLKHYDLVASKQQKALLQETNRHPVVAKVNEMRQLIIQTLNKEKLLNDSQTLKVTEFPVTNVDQQIKIIEIPDQHTTKIPLESHRVVSSNDWWSKATLRIDLIKQVSDTVSKQILHDSNILRINALRSLVLYVVLSAVALGLIVVLAHLLLVRLSGEIVSMTEKMRNMTVTDDFDQLLNVSGNDEVASMANAFNDLIVGRKRVDDKLQKFSLAVEQSASMVMITNAVATIEYVNAKFCEVTGYTQEEVIGKTPQRRMALS